MGHSKGRAYGRCFLVMWILGLVLSVAFYVQFEISLYLYRVLDYEEIADCEQLREYTNSAVNPNHTMSEDEWEPLARVEF